MQFPNVLRCGSCGSGTKLLSMLVMTGSFMLVELIVGNMTNSMALIADSFHMLSDVIALVIAFVSVKISPKKWSRNTYGWARAEVVGALVNAVFLITLCFSIVMEAIKRFLMVEPIDDPHMIMIVGGIGLAINMIGLLIFGHGHAHGGGGHGHAHSGHGHGVEEHDHDHGGGGHSHNKGQGGKKKMKELASGSNMNMTGVFLHVLGDALGSVVVLISGAVIMWTDWEYKEYCDPLLSLIIVLIISTTSWPLLRDSTLVLLNTIPPSIDLASLETSLVNTVRGVQGIHELHVWQLVGSRVIASCHLEMSRPDTGGDPVTHHMEVAREVKEFFHREGIHSTTIQLEYSTVVTSPGSASCHLLCPKTFLPSGVLSPQCEEGSCCRNSRGGREV